MVIISLRFGRCFFQNHELCFCFNVIDKPTPFFQSESYPEWSSHFSHVIQTVLHDFAFVKKSTCQFAWVWLPKARTLGAEIFKTYMQWKKMEQGRAHRIRKADLFVKGRISERVPGGTWNISLEFSIYIYICPMYMYVCVCGNKQACQLFLRISQVGGMLWLQHFGVVAA